ncbi:MAG: hypothetical protein HYW89_04650 [Candidatus Sungiibacteriota bacterium]|uniref:Uncharacterized protein n=1 Tax=Candidatus Sungiibacteriota bacterium TaxID=2750080 RepID=A0A7T5RKA1_9BACT|nr:MAG: hypothetical protein HYW89_04650 [Candidatus Sungbacteria bacterium]
MIFLVAGLLVGTTLYTIGYLARDLEDSEKRTLKLVGLLSATAGAMMWLSALYLTYPGVFTGLALGLGALMAVVGYYYKGAEKLLLLSYGLLPIGVLMLMMKTGWFLFVAILVVATIVYFNLVKTGKAEKLLQNLEERLP